MDFVAVCEPRPKPPFDDLPLYLFMWFTSALLGTYIGGQLWWH